MKKRHCERERYITGASVLLILDVQIHDFEEPACFILDGLDYVAQRLFIEACLYRQNLYLNGKSQRNDVLGDTRLGFNAHIA